MAGGGRTSLRYQKLQESQCPRNTFEESKTIAESNLGRELGLLKGHSLAKLHSREAIRERCAREAKSACMAETTGDWGDVSCNDDSAAHALSIAQSSGTKSASLHRGSKSSSSITATKEMHGGGVYTPRYNPGVTHKGSEGLRRLPVARQLCTSESQTRRAT